MRQESTYQLEHPPEVVFSYIDNPDNISKISPTIKSSKGVERSENGGWVVEIEYKVLNDIASGKTNMMPEEYEENERIRYSIDDDISGYIDWYFEEEDGGTLFTHEVEYEVEIPVPKFFVNTVGKKLAEREINSVVSNIKDGLSDAEN